MKDRGRECVEKPLDKSPGRYICPYCYMNLEGGKIHPEPSKKNLDRFAAKDEEMRSSIQDYLKDGSQYISIIVAMTKDKVIGHNGDIPWSITEDLKRFRRITTGSTIVMGSKTHYSIGRTLPERENIVVARDPSFIPYQHSIKVSTPLEAIQQAKGEEIFIIGGEYLFYLFYPICTKIYLTEVLFDCEGDTFFTSDFCTVNDFKIIKFETHEDHLFYELEKRP